MSRWDLNELERALQTESQRSTAQEARSDSPYPGSDGSPGPSRSTQDMTTSSSPMFHNRTAGNGGPSQGSSSQSTDSSNGPPSSLPFVALGDAPETETRRPNFPTLDRFMAEQDAADDVREVAEAVVNKVAWEQAEAARAAITDPELAAQGIDLATYMADRPDDVPDISMQGLKVKKEQIGVFKRKLKERKNFFAALCLLPELCLEVAKWIRPKDMLNLYCVSRDFHETINGHLGHVITSTAQIQCPISAKLYKWHLYKALCRQDPTGRLNSRGEVRWIPGLPWLQMVQHRDVTVRNIMACLARQGHLLPPGSSLSLKKMWLLMDISTCQQRAMFIRNREFFTDVDLYNIQCFIVKLDMRFNDPIDGPGNEGMRKLFLGQRGLTPLCHLLMRTKYRGTAEIVVARIRYDYQVARQHRGLPIWDVLPHEIGRGHLEGWGQGRIHLLRPDELLLGESIRRKLNLKAHLFFMLIYGHVDPKTCRNVEITKEDMYISDDEGWDNPEWDSKMEYEDVEMEGTREVGRWGPGGEMEIQDEGEGKGKGVDRGGMDVVREDEGAEQGYVGKGKGVDRSETRMAEDEDTEMGMGSDGAKPGPEAAAENENTGVAVGRARGRRLMRGLREEMDIW